MFSLKLFCLVLSLSAHVNGHSVFFYKHPSRMERLQKISLLFFRLNTPCYLILSLHRRGAPDPGVSLGTLKTAFLSEITAVRVSINKWCIEMSKVLLFWFLIMETYGNIQQNSKATHLKLTEKYGTHFHQIQFGAYIFIGKISISAVILKSIIWEFAWFWAKSKLYMIETNESCPYRDKV